MKHLLFALTVSILLCSCAATMSVMTPQVGETWRAKCYEKTHPMDFKITDVEMGFTTYRDSTAIYKVPTYTFQHEFVRTCLAGSDVILMRFHNKSKHDDSDRSLTSKK